MTSLTQSLSAETEELRERLRPALKFGWIAKGLLFAIIGVLAVELARRGSAPEDADQTGALAALAEAPAGRILVAFVSGGLALYAAWQVGAALVQDRTEPIHLARRVGWIGLALVYGLIAHTGMQIALRGGSAASGSSGSSSGGPTTPGGLSQDLMGLPGGRLVVAAIGIGTIIVGGYHLWKGVSGDFLDDIETDSVDDRWHGPLRALGTTGFAARAALLAIAGWLFIEAARTYDPDRAAGIDQSLRTLASVPAGRILLAVCGIGLFAAGTYDAVTYRWQRIDEVSDGDDF